MKNSMYTNFFLSGCLQSQHSLLILVLLIGEISLLRPHPEDGKNVETSILPATDDVAPREVTLSLYPALRIADLVLETKATQDSIPVQNKTNEVALR